MSSRLIPALLVVAAALAYACGPKSHASEPTSEPAAQGPGLISSLEVSVGNRHEVALTLHVSNNTPRRLELSFPNGQTHDFTVLDSVGRVVWRWSDGRLFTQVLRNRVLDENESMKYQVAWLPGTRSGTYTAVASLLSANHPMERRVEFTVP